MTVSGETASGAAPSGSLDGKPFALWIGFVVALLGGLVLLAWRVELVTVSRVLPRESSSLMLLGAGISLGFAARSRERSRAASVPALVVLAIASFSAVDQLLLGAEAAPVGDGGGVSPLPTAIAFVGIGFALLLSHSRTIWHAYVPAVGTAVIALIGLCGYALGLRASDSVLAGMSPGALVGIATLTVGIFSRWPQLPPFSWITLDTPGSRLARRLGPVMVVLPVAMGILTTRWESISGLSTESGAAVAAAVTIAALTGVMAVSVGIIDRGEARAADARERARAELARSEELHRLTIANLPGAMVGLYDAELRCVLLEGEYSRGDLSTEKCAGKRLAEISGQVVADQLEPAMRDALAGRATEMEYSPPGSATISHFKITPFRGGAGDQIEGVLIVAADITEQRLAKQAQNDALEQLAHLALHDPLTGLINRRGLEIQLWHQSVRVERYGAAGALLLLDLDGFKAVNDALGHAVGDELLVGVAEALGTQLRQSDTIARLGGDEFAVLIPEGSRNGAVFVAGKLIAAVAAQAAVLLEGRHVGAVTASVGVAGFDPALSADEVLVRADRAMYDAKRAGKARVALDATPVGPTLLDAPS